MCGREEHIREQHLEYVCGLRGLHGEHRECDAVRLCELHHVDYYGCNVIPSVRCHQAVRGYHGQKRLCAEELQGVREHVQRESSCFQWILN